MPHCRFILLLGALLVTACTSRSVDLNYYMLHSPQAEQHSQPDSNVRVVIDDIQLPDYLLQRQLALQTSDTTLHFSSQHVWSTTQDEAIRRLLTGGLRQRNIAVISPASPLRDDSHTRVSITIDDFIPTWQGELILKGEYVIQRSESESTLKTFDYRTTLQEDGFTHSVAKMRELTDQLSQQLSNDLE